MKKGLIFAAIMGLGWAIAAPAQAPTLAMLDQLEKGSWALKDRASGTVLRTVCIGDGKQLIQVRHPQAACSRYIITDSANEVTVHYTCGGQGHGRTTIRRETNRLTQIDTQGVAGGMPFSSSIEARRLGACQ
jgi:Protein of unknown function (DUF3617)